MATIQNYLADLPDFVTTEILAHKLGIKVKSVYQRHWRQKQNPKLKLLPLLLPIPGSSRLGTSKQAVIDWWLSASLPVVEKRVGRPTKADKIARLEALS